ncbi:TSUP family transporter [Paracoccus sp. (in: a-proteobacteria)]|uniref:TSUP family transporter n=1 Tax=Paracoccus sp. TaxID=267 RepID=UPI003A8567EE
MLDLSLDLILMLAAAAFAAGFVDSIAGGGGLITVPVLMLAGLPPTQALATNKVQGIFGAATAAISYARRGLVTPSTQIREAAVALVAGFLGTLCVTSIPTEALRYLLPVLLIAIALFFAFKPGLNDFDRARRMSPALFAISIVPLIGFYDGLIGPGTGAFFMLGFVTLAGYGVLKANAHTKLLNFASNLGSLIAFAAVAKPLWLLGAVMAVAQIAGAMLGSRLAMRVGARVIKPVLVITSSLLALQLLRRLF